MQISLNLGSYTRKSTCHGKTPELCWICSPNHELYHRLLGRAINCNATQQSRDTRETNKAKQSALFLPHQDDCKTRMDIKLRSDMQISLNLGSYTRKSTCHGKTPELCWICSPNHELYHRLLGRAINCNVTSGLCARCHPVK